jgi:hypothetical protein
MAKTSEADRLSALLKSVNVDVLASDVPQIFQDDSIRVERILLDLVRPDPIQPRRVLPDRIHHAFHAGKLTPSQALRELVQIAQVAARQRGRPFSNLLELIPDSEGETGAEINRTPEEELLFELVSLAMTIRNDGQVNPITVVDVSQSAARMYRIETGERRYWAAWLLRDFLPGYESDGMIDCLVVAPDRASSFRQARENTARKGLSAIAMARQAALLILTVNGCEIPNYAITNDFYRQALDLRIPRGAAEPIYSAMGGIDKRRFSQYKDLLKLSDEAMEIADRHQLDERVLRLVAALPEEDQIEMIQQVVQLRLTSRQVEAIINQGVEASRPDEEALPDHAIKLARMLVRDIEKHDANTLWQAMYHEQRDPHMAQAYLKRLAHLALAAANQFSSEG